MRADRGVPRFASYPGPHDLGYRPHHQRGRSDHAARRLPGDGAGRRAPGSRAADAGGRSGRGQRPGRRPRLRLPAGRAQGVAARAAVPDPGRRRLDHRHVLRREPDRRTDHQDRAGHAARHRGHRGRPVLPARRHRPPRHRARAGQQQPGRRDPGRLDADPAVRQADAGRELPGRQRPQVRRGGDQPQRDERLRPQAAGAEVRRLHREDDDQAADPAGLPQHRLLRVRHVRRGIRCAALLQRPREPAQPAAGGSAGRAGPGAEQLRPVHEHDGRSGPPQHRAGPDADPARTSPRSSTTPPSRRRSSCARASRATTARRPSTPTSATTSAAS